MSQPGYWKMKTGEEIRIQDMDEPHLKNSMRLLRNRILNPAYGRAYVVFTEGQLAELGNEAQRRGLIPAGDIPMHALMAVIATWQAAWDARPPRAPFVANPAITNLGIVPSYRPPAPQPFRRVSNISPPALVSKNIDVEIEISRVTGYRVTAVPYGDTLERRLDTDL
jgi:hypothetical protein